MTERVHLSDLDSDGRAALFEGEPHTVFLALAAGDEIPPHRHPDRDVVCHVLEGELSMRLGEERHDLQAGDVLRFDGDQDISPVARSDCEAVLVLASR